MKKLMFSTACTVTYLILLSGCTKHLRNEQLEQVAKDWSYVIRASQVIPVYPLTEDLQPGDVLLVRTPIDEQQKLYAEKGYLPLDQLLKRLNPTEYRDFYRERYGTNDTKIPPSKWQEFVTASDGNKKHQWDLAPYAAFPSYSFEVTSGGGLNLAIPVQGVPIALGFMNSGKANGTISIGKSYTYGLDNVTLKKDVEEWSTTNRELLRSYAPIKGDNENKKFSFLRVISRVYAISDLNVSIQNNEATSGELAGGADKEVPVQILNDQDTAQNYQDALAIFNEALKDQLPGGKVKFAMASKRSVSLNEQFERPLIIGYIGFDMPILEGGRLGAPISTLSQLSGSPILPAEETSNIYRLAAMAHMFNALKQIPGSRADEIRKNLDALGSYLPEAYSFSLYEFSTPTDVRKSSEIISGAKISKRDFSGVIDYLAYGQQTIDNLSNYLDLPKVIPAAEKTELSANLRAAKESIENINQNLGRQSAIAEAVDYVFLGY